MDATKLLYLDDSNCLGSSGTVLSVEDGEQTKLVLDQTIMYPQGGGQPYDTGTIMTENAVFKVAQVRFMDGVVFHIGDYEQGAFAAGEDVRIAVDPERRQLNCRLHTAGHLIDAAMKAIGKQFPPTKGYHFPDSPYVEYEGQIPPEERESVIHQLQASVDQLIAENSKVEDRLVPLAELDRYCDFVPDYVPADKPSRVVTVAGLGCPCGGTHVDTLSQIGNLQVTKIKSKSGNLRISYKVL